MSDTGRVRAALDVAERVAYEGEAVTAEDVDIDDIDDVRVMLNLWRRATRQAQAARSVESAYAQQLARLLGEGGAIAAGPSIIRYTRGWKEVCIDPSGLELALTTMARDGVIDAGKLAAPSQIRKTAIPPVLRSTFYDRVDDDEPSLKVMPRDKAPKFLQALNDGDVRLGGGA